ncbi:hypothetical protein K1T71_013757, partial [Dendrolimus kikuchii]
RSLMAQPAAAGAGVMRRPFGVAVADVKRYLTTDSSDKDIQVPFYPYDKENLDALLKKVIANRDFKDAKHSQGLWVSLQLVEGDLKQIREETPHIVSGNTAVARKMGFPEVILPGDARNDLYVTVVSGSFSKGGGKSSERNIELVARVVDQNGRVLPLDDSTKGVISIGAGVPLVKEYTSIVYYHDDRPRWQEVFKVCLNIEEFKEAHLVFLCRHRSSNEAKDRAEKHFALSYLRLMQREGTTTPDTTHNLCVYKIEYKRAGGEDAEAAAAAACLGLPSRRDELPAGAERGLTRAPLSLVHKDTLTVATRLCSTKLTQKEEILGVLKWSTHHSQGTLRTALSQLLHVPSEELVKFLQDILDALFNILTQVGEDHDSYSDRSYGVLVLECLLRVISIVADHKYQHFQPVLHVYIDESFCDALAYENLISVIVWTIKTANTSDAALKRLLMCMKCVESLVRVIVRSRQLRSALGDSDADRDFQIRFKELLEALVWLMRCGDHALTCQGSALKYLPCAVPHAIKVYPAEELCASIVRALEALPLGRLSKQRMLALLELVRGPLCASAAPRALLLPHLAATLRALLRDKAEWDREAALKSRSVGKAARLLGADTARLHDHTHHQQIVELCIETLGEVYTLLASDDVGPVDADRGQLARRLLPTVLKTAASMLKDRAERSDESVSASEEATLRRMVSVLLDMVWQMSADQYKMVVKALEAESIGGAGSLVMDALSLLLALLQKPVFKPYWADMLHLQHYIMLHALKLLSLTLCERLRGVEYGDARSAAHAQCRLWFEAGAATATSPVLQLEALPPARRQRLNQLYGDIRRGVAHCFLEMWYTLGDHKRSFIPCLVGPFLEVSFLRDDEVRNTTIPVFFDMMQTEYTHSVASGESMESHLKELESELIDKVDVLVERGCGDAAWRAKFVTLCGALCSAASGPLRPAAAALVAAAARQLDTLLQYRAAASRSATPHRMHLTTTVLHFYQHIERPHMYIRYVHKLAAMYRSAQMWAEAGLTLRLHAKLLAWSHDPLPPRLRHPTVELDRHFHRDLKEYLYLEIAELLNQGRQWELAVEVIKELVSVYEEEALGYGPLAELHAQLASLYAAMLKTPRSHPGYFRVIYHGKGFPELLRKPNVRTLRCVVQGFVYRGVEYEQLQGFKERLLDEWPDAEVLLKLDPPGEDITDSDGQYLQINAVDPILSDKLKRLSGKPVAEQILQYYKHNNVDKFVFSRPSHRPEESLGGSKDDLSSQNEFATLWLERTELEISDKLPGILRWFPVVNQRTYWVSPIEYAVEDLRNSNRMLKSVAFEARTPDAPLHPLTMRLNGILDPAVQGGIANYERAFLNAAYEARHPEHAPLLAQLKDLIADQIPVLKFGLDVHGSRMSPEMEELHQHMLKCFRRIQQHVHQRYGRSVWIVYFQMCDFDTESQEVQLRMTLRDSTQTDSGGSANNRISDVSTGNNESGIKSAGRFFSFNSAINPLSRNSSGGVVSYFGTLQSTPKRRNKRQAGRKSEVGTQASSTQSQWYTSPSIPNGSLSSPLPVSNNNSALNSVGNTPSSGTQDTPSASPLRELRQEEKTCVQLVTERPLRAEAEWRHSRRASLVTSSAPPSNRDSIGTNDSNQDEEEPPPLPKKFSHRSMDLDNDTNNNNGDTNLHLRQNYDTVWTPRGSFLYNSMAQRRSTATSEKAPTPPPKKKNAQ